MIKRLQYVNPKDITVKRVYKALKRRIKNIPTRLEWDLNLSKKAKKNKEAIEKFRDIHKGKRCFVIANGPSLSKIDFELLKDEYTIGMNRIYLMEDQTGFKPNYLAVADVTVQLEQFTEEYLNFDGPKFYSWFGHSLFPDNAKDLYYFFVHFKNDFAPDFTKTIGNGKSVTYSCIQLAYYLGFEEVILIGKDHSYDVTGNAGEKIVATGEEKNHFIKGYYYKGQVWKVPNYEEEEYTYLQARKGFEAAGRRIVDATIDGKLNVFEKVDYSSLFDKK
jgi:hypothetical protein